MKSSYAHAVPAILADVENEQQEQAQPGAPGNPVNGNGNGQAQDQPEPEVKRYVYRTDDGGIFISPRKIGDDETLDPPIVESAPSNATERKEPSFFAVVFIIFCLFLVLNSADTALTALFSPTANITIIPQVQALTITATFSIGKVSGNVQGRVLPALTIIQSQTIPATGRGHQDARAAAGSLIFFNGAFSSQTINAGTVYTGRSGVQVATDQSVTIPAASPPYLGQASVNAHVVRPGSSGNIQAGDIRIATATLQVKNSQFQNGQDARDFSFVTTSDLRQAISTLTPLVMQAEQGALNSQLRSGEQITLLPCTPSAISNHKSGEEATSVQVTVSATCKAVAYEDNSLQSAALRFVQSRLTKLNSHYQLIGTIQVTVRSTSMQQGSATVDAAIHGVWMYQLNERAIQSIVAGKPRLAAIQLLQKLPGVQRITISGLSDNSPLPDDLTHIHILILVQE